MLRARYARLARRGRAVTILATTTTVHRLIFRGAFPACGRQLQPESADFTDWAARLGITARALYHFLNTTCHIDFEAASQPQS